MDRIPYEGDVGKIRENEGKDDYRLKDHGLP